MFLLRSLVVDGCCKQIFQCLFDKKINSRLKNFENLIFVNEIEENIPLFEITNSNFQLKFLDLSKVLIKSE